MTDRRSKLPGLLLIISGPSGVGKTTIARNIEKELGGVFSVSMTTRPKTERDRPGLDYHFVDREAFERCREQGGLLEWAEVFGHYYGTPSQPVYEGMADGKLVILEIDVEGATQIKKRVPEALAVFIEPPDEQDLLVRLRGRRREDEAAIQRRFSKAKDEISRANAGDVYDTFVVNDDLPKTTRRLIDDVRAMLKKRSELEG